MLLHADTLQDELLLQVRSLCFCLTIGLFTFQDLHSIDVQVWCPSACTPPKYKEPSGTWRLLSHGNNGACHIILCQWNSNPAKFDFYTCDVIKCTHWVEKHHASGIAYASCRTIFIRPTGRATCSEFCKVSNYWWTTEVINVRQSGALAE